MPPNFRLLMLVVALVLAACGDRTSIQTGEVGKVLGDRGLEKDIRKPGAFRMDACVFDACPKLVRLQVNKSTNLLTIDSLFLPKSNVDIRKVEVGIQFQVKQDEASIHKVFEEVRPSAPDEKQVEESHRVLLITAESVYDTFLKRKVADAIITELRKHTVDEVLTEVPEIAHSTKEQINAMLADTPIEVTEVGFPNGIGVVPDEVINAKRRLFAVEEERARKIKSLAADLVIEDQRQLVQRKRVENDVVNAKAAGVDYMTYVWLKTFERFADASGDGTPVALGAQLLPATVSPVEKGG